MKFALSVALATLLSIPPVEAMPASPATLAPTAPAAAVQTVDYFAFGYSAGPRRYYAPRYVAPRYVAPRYVAPRRIVRGPCRTKVVKYTRRGTVVRTANRCW